MKGFPEPNYTQTPNALFDHLMKDMGEAELRVTLAVIRKTMGFHKERDAISWTQIMEMTGLSRTSTQDGIDKAIAHGFIKIVGKGKRGVNVFALVVEAYQSLDRSTNTTSTGSATLPDTSSVPLPTKEKANKPAKEKNRDPNLERWEKVAVIGNALLKVFSNDFVPVENQTFAALEPYLIAAEDLTRVGAPIEHIEPLYKYVLARSERENWNGFTVKALPKYYTEFLKSLKKTAPARRPAPIIDASEPTAAELEAQRAELEAARKAIRPDWEKAVVNE